MFNNRLELQQQAILESTRPTNSSTITNIHSALKEDNALFKQLMK